MRLGVLGVALLAAGCGADVSTAPSAPMIAQVAGVWRGTETVTSVTGGECFATIFQGTVGVSSAISAALTQSGSALTASITALSNGAVCNYTGTAGVTAVQFSWTNCSSSNLLGAVCPNGSRRDLLLVNSSLTGTLVGNTITGTDAASYNLVVAGTSTPVGIVTVASTFAVTRQ